MLIDTKTSSLRAHVVSVAISGSPRSLPLPRDDRSLMSPSCDDGSLRLQSRDDELCGSLLRMPLSFLNKL